MSANNAKAIESRVSAAETSIQQNKDAIALSAKRLGTVANPNLTPFFEMPVTATTDDYWANVTFARITRLGDGWAHFEYSNSGTSTVNNYIKPRALDSLVPGGTYTLLLEFRNVSISASGGSIYSQQDSNTQVWGTTAYGGFSVSNASLMALEGGEGRFHEVLTPLDADSKDPSGTVRGNATKTAFIGINWQVVAGQSISADLRISLYEGEYDGPWKPYSGSQLYASQAELKVTADEVSSKVSKDGVISSINQSAESVRIQASRVEIDGAATFSAIKASADAAYDAKGAASTALTSAKAYTEASVLASGVEYIEGTQTAATNLWTGVTKEASLAAGKTIAYRLPYAGNSSAATLNLTLAGGGTTGAKNIRQVYSTSSNTGALSTVTTHWPVGSIIQMTYDGTQWLISNYNTNVDTHNHVRLQNNITAAAAITAAHLICGTSAGYKNIAASVAFDLSYPILYAGSAIAAAATGTNNYLQTSSIAASNNGTIASGAAKLTLYLKGTVSGGTFTVAASPFMTTVAPTAEDGFFYIPLGVMYDATHIYFNSSKDLYAYLDGGFRQVTPAEVVATQHVYRSAASGTASMAATTTWVTASGDTQGAWTTKRPTYSGSYPVLFVARQTKRLDGTVTCTTPVKDDTTTVIDGGHITTGTIDATKVAVTKLSASNITSGTLSADRIDADSINASGMLTVGAMSSEYNEALSSQLGGIAESIDGLVESQSGLTKSVGDLTEDVGELDQRLKDAETNAQWLHFDADTGLTIGEEDGLNRLVATSTELAFMTGQEKAAWASAGVFHAQSLVSDGGVEAASVGTGDWAWSEFGGGFGLQYLGE